ncbi:MAG TPA: 23S rRNA (adenine(2503)-C(2))-methyltransferase RlmN, partial [Patescibacteria group bacterium]|nr:23S rRNA (adenine(2503)-C(2))-methyltransferase RlmN [Patescibacteria group bacterium]
SQVGCTLTCKFCHTGTQPLVRNLGAHEILQQIMHARDALNEWPAKDKKDEGRDLTNIVMMGMGEPLYNYDNVAKALKICMDEEGLGISKRRITLSTSGVVPQIVQCGEELNVNLAISLHAPTNELRSAIMPINNKYPLDALLAACRNYPGLSENRRITFEYVMLKDVNDSDENARALTGLLRGIPSKINIIPFNSWPGSGYECSTPERIDSFARILEEAGYDAPVRRPRGRDILAACGQLKSASQRAKVTAPVLPKTADETEKAAG